MDWHFRNTSMLKILRILTIYSFPKKIGGKRNELIKRLLCWLGTEKIHGSEDTHPLVTVNCIKKVT